MSAAKPLIILLLMAGLPAAADITRLSWLSGCWAYDGQEPGSGEIWMRPAGGSMLAVSRTIRDGRTIGFEYLRIAETDGDSLALFASPSAKTPVRFDLVDLTDSEVVFENPEHDFPQRIRYRLGADGTLLGHIEGLADGKSVAVDFPMTAVDCKEFAG